MQPEELIERIKGLNNLVIKLGKRDAEALAELDLLHKEAFGIGYEVGCKKCYTQAFHKLQSLTIQKLIEMKQQKYKLKKGVVIQYPAFSPNMYTLDNMTDEVAEEYLNENPEGKQFFEDFEKDEIEEAEKPTSAKDLVKKIELAETVEEVNSLAPETDDRVSVRAAALKRTEELNKPKD